MGYYDDPYEEEPRDENWEFHDAIENVMTKEIEDRVSSIKKDYEYQKADNKKLYKRVHELENQLKESQNDNKSLHTKTSFIDDVLKNLNKDNISQFIGIVYKPDFNESSGMNEVPIWFLLEVNYYSNRTKILDLLETIGIEIPNEARKLRLPFDWSKEELDTFFDYMCNNVNCNGETFEYNLCFWYGEKWENPIANCKCHYSEIPWQFILRHPLLNSTEYCLRMAKEINDGYNGLNFLAILNYQTLDDENLKLLIDNIKVNNKTSEQVISFLLKHIELVTGKEALNQIYSHLENKWQAQKYLYKMPKEYLKRYIKKQKKNEARDIIFDSPLTEEEKLEMIKELM